MKVADLIGEIGNLHLINYLKILANDKINYVTDVPLIVTVLVYAISSASSGIILLNAIIALL